MRFRKSITLFKGFRLNFSKSGISTTIGGKGASINIGKKGTYLNTSIPGTGLYDRKRISPPSMSKKPGGLKTVCIAIGVMLIVVSFIATFKVVLFLLGVAFFSLGIVLSKKERRIDQYIEAYTVYVTRSGSKYHSSKNCPVLQSAKMIGEMPVDEAVNNGLSACEKCM
jgi:hypothetical protein